MVEVKNTTKSYSTTIIKKRSARVLAVQCVYSVTTVPLEDTKTIDDRILGIIDLYSDELSTSKLSRANQTFLIKLVREVFDKKTELESIISQHLSSEWRFERLAKVIQSVLLVGACELFLDKELDKEIIINEYLEIAKIFSHDGEVGFLNHVLDQLAKHR